MRSSRVVREEPTISTTPNRGAPPWLLAAILAVIVAAVVLLAVFRNQIRNAFKSPTATPVVATVVVTNTPLSGTPGHAAAVPPTATAGAAGVSTPVPGATPQPTVAGLKLGMITHKAATVTTIQQRAAAGNPSYVFYLQPRQVVQNTLAQYGFRNGFEIVAPNPAPTPTPYIGADKRPLVKFLVAYQGRFYSVYVAQPAAHGAKGIWLIVTINAGSS